MAVLCHHSPAQRVNMWSPHKTTIPTRDLPSRLMRFHLPAGWSFPWRAARSLLLGSLWTCSLASSRESVRLSCSSFVHRVWCARLAPGHWMRGILWLCPLLHYYQTLESGALPGLDRNTGDERFVEEIKLDFCTFLCCEFFLFHLN